MSGSGGGDGSGVACGVGIEGGGVEGGADLDGVGDSVADGVADSVGVEDVGVDIRAGRTALSSQRPARTASAIATSTAATRATRRRVIGITVTAAAAAGAACAQKPCRPMTTSSAERRDSGFLWSENSTMRARTGGTPGAENGGGSEFRTAVIVSIGVSPAKARAPVIISYTMAPKVNMSDRRSTISPRTCSGDI